MSVKLINLIAMLICTVSMLINYKNRDRFVVNALLAILNGLLYIGG